MNPSGGGGGADPIACRFSQNNFLAISLQNNRISIFDASGN
jgi:hypothetical protein